MTERKRRNRTQILVDFKEKTGNWKLKEEALDRTVWKRLWTYHRTDNGMNEYALRRPETPTEFSCSDMSEIGHLRH